MPMRLPADIFDKAYTILIEYAGASASEVDRQDFIQSYTQLKSGPFVRYSFIGKLGLGGAFYNNCGRIYIACSKEDETEERILIIKNVNGLLDNLLDSYIDGLE